MLYDFFAHLKDENLKSNNYEEFMAACNNTSKCGHIAMTRLKYTKDDGEYWQTPTETFGRRNSRGKMLGDCDDYARLFAETLRKAGRDVYFMVMFDDESGHATCLCDNETVGTFYHIDHGTSDIEKIAAFWYPRWLVIRTYRQKPQTLDFELEVVERRTRSYDEIAAIPRKVLNSKLLGDMFDFLAAIDTETYMELMDELLEE